VTDRRLEVNAEKMAVATRDVADDVEISFSNGAGEEQELLEEGPYKARLVNFKVEVKPDWKISRDRERNPDREPDEQQYAWYFELIEDGYEGHTITDWTARSFHPKSNGGKYAAYLLGKIKLDGDEGMSTRGLVGKPLMLFVTQSNGKNYCSAAKSFPIKKAKLGGKQSIVEPDKAALTDDYEF
jgi:hypothetical protein